MTPTTLKIHIWVVHRGQALYIAARALSSFITQTMPGCVGREKASQVAGIWLLAPKLTVHPYALLCARNCLPRRPRVCSHQSHVLFVPHWLVGSSPPAAVETSVSVPAKWGTQMCVCDGGWGQMLMGTSSSQPICRGKKNHRQLCSNK